MGIVETKTGSSNSGETKTGSSNSGEHQPVLQLEQARKTDENPQADNGRGTTWGSSDARNSICVLVCDPCCKGTQSEQEETITGYRAATFYANAGIHYFQGLLALEHSDYTNANTNFEQFYVAANELRIVLDGADSTLTQSIEEVIEYGEAMSILQGRELPDIETITELGKKWAQLQTIANDAVLRSCQSR